jgi:hypothetical protein
MAWFRSPRGCGERWRVVHRDMRGSAGLREQVATRGLRKVWFRREAPAIREREVFKADARGLICYRGYSVFSTSSQQPFHRSSAHQSCYHRSSSQSTVLPVPEKIAERRRCLSETQAKTPGERYVGVQRSSLIILSLDLMYYSSEFMWRSADRGFIFNI